MAPLQIIKGVNSHRAYYRLVHYTSPYVDLGPAHLSQDVMSRDKYAVRDAPVFKIVRFTAVIYRLLPSCPTESKTSSFFSRNFIKMTDFLNSFIDTLSNEFILK